jgi:hypothetical protein
MPFRNGRRDVKEYRLLWDMGGGGDAAVSVKRLRCRGVDAEVWAEDEMGAGCDYAGVSFAIGHGWRRGRGGVDEVVQI